MSEAVKDTLHNSEPFEAETPRPLVREIAEPEPYPVEALGSLRPAIMAIHEHTRAPVAICGQSVLGAVSLAGQAHADVRLPTGQRRPLSQFLLTIAASGDRKSAVDRLALGPVYEREDQLRVENAAALVAYQNATDIYDAQALAPKSRARMRPKLRPAKPIFGRLASHPKNRCCPCSYALSPRSKGTAS